MKRFNRYWLLLYPRRWRERYQSEFEALLEDAGTSWSDRFDIFKGAILMRLSAFKGIPASKTILLCAFVGLLCGMVAPRWMKKVYVSTAVLRVPSKEELRPAPLAALGRKQLTAVMDEFTLYPEERKHMPLEDVAEKMGRGVKVASVPISEGPPVFSLSFEYSDSGLAQSVTAALVQRLSATMRSTSSHSSLVVLDGPKLPIYPISPSVPRAAATGALAGALIGVLLAALTARVRHRPDYHSV